MPAGATSRGEGSRFCWMLSLPLGLVDAILRLETPARAWACRRALPGSTGVGCVADGVADTAEVGRFCAVLSAPN